VWAKYDPWSPNLNNVLHTPSSSRIRRFRHRKTPPPLPRISTFFELMFSKSKQQILSLPPKKNPKIITTNSATRCIRPILISIVGGIWADLRNYNRHCVSDSERENGYGFGYVRRIIYIRWPATRLVIIIIIIIFARSYVRNGGFNINFIVTYVHRRSGTCLPFIDSCVRAAQEVSRVDGLNR